MSTVALRAIVYALTAALLVALGVAGWQWRAATALGVEKAQVVAQFATYRAQAATNHAAALEKLKVDKARTEKIRQEALDAEFIARKAAQADLAAVRAGNGRLQRHATDLATSLAARAGDPAAASSCSAAEARIRILGDVVGALDDFASRAVEAADGSRIAGELCERTYDSLRQ